MGEHPYRWAAMWAAILVAAAWAMVWVPTKVFHASGEPPTGYLTALGFHLLMPGGVASLFLYRPPHDSTGGLISLSIVLSFSWLFYFGVFASVARLWRRNKNACSAKINR